MGLDSVELVMAFEEAFEIQIEDDEAAKMLTPRDVIEYVLRRVGHSDSTGCLTQRAFNLLRKTLIQTTGLSRREIKPSASLNELVPKPERAQLREQFSAILCTHAFPEFVRPRFLVSALTGISLAVGIAIIAMMPMLLPWSGFGMALVLGGVGAALTGYASAAATWRQRTEFPSAIATVGDLSRWIMHHRRDPGATAAQRAWAREQVAGRVREIVIEHLDCAEAYREDARFIQDLGMD